MVRIVREELWQPTDGLCLIVVTTSGSINTRNRLVMGRGAAHQARERLPGIDRECARAIKDALQNTRLRPLPRGVIAIDLYSRTGYYFQVVREPRVGKPGFGVFQVKEHFGDKADLELIRRSAIVLARYAGRHRDVQIRLNYPGIGWGHLRREKVEPLLACLPENVTICYQ